MKLEILHEDNHLIIVNKPNGVLTHGDRTGDRSMEDMVREFIRDKYNKPGNVFTKSAHRLDRPVSGINVFGKTSKGHERMARVFRDRQVQKIYWALTTKRPAPDKGMVTQYLTKDRARNVVRWHRTQVAGSKEAVTSYRLLGFYDPFYLVEMRPVSGRSHQLRVVMRSKRCPIAGDVKYGGRKISSPHALLLHAREITFVHPVKKEQMTIVAPIPEIEEWQYVMSQYSDPHT